jgi:hypothetical protein
LTRRRIEPQLDHVLPEQLGGEALQSKHARRSPALNVVPSGWRPKKGVPNSRAECPSKRPCVFIRCRYHLWLKLSQDRDGRRWPNGKQAPSEFWPTGQTSCALDVADAVRARGEDLTFQELGELLGVGDERARVILHRACLKLEVHGVSLGVEKVKAREPGPQRDKVTENELDAIIAEFEAA